MITKSHVKTKATSQSIHLYNTPLCARELHCCPETIKNSSMSHIVTLNDICNLFRLNRTHYHPVALNIDKRTKCTSLHLKIDLNNFTNDLQSNTVSLPSLLLKWYRKLQNHKFKIPGYKFHTIYLNKSMYGKYFSRNLWSYL